MVRKNIIILFGEMGAGKNYWGEKLAADYQYPFFDGDTVATAEVIKRVSQFKPLNRDIVRRYVSRLMHEIADRAEKSVGLIVAQALYLEEDRRFLNIFLEALGYNVIFRWVKPTFWNNLKQIFSRPRGFRWVLYWLMNKPFFQKPRLKHDIIE